MMPFSLKKRSIGVPKDLFCTSCDISYVRNLWLHWIFDWIADIAAVCFFFWSDSVDAWDPRGSGWCQMFRGAGNRKGPCQASKRFDFTKKKRLKKIYNSSTFWGLHISTSHKKTFQTEEKISLSTGLGVYISRCQYLSATAPVQKIGQKGVSFKSHGNKVGFELPGGSFRFKSAVIYGILGLFWSPPIL